MKTHLYQKVFSLYWFNQSLLVAALSEKLQLTLCLSHMAKVDDRAGGGDGARGVQEENNSAKPTLTSD